MALQSQSIQKHKKQSPVAQSMLQYLYSANFSTFAFFKSHEVELNIYSVKIHFNHHHPKETLVTKLNLMERSIVLQGRCHWRSILSPSEPSQPNYRLPSEVLSWHWFVDQNSLKISILHVTKSLDNFCIQIIVFHWLEKGMTIHSSILAWRIPWTEEPDGYSSRGHKELDTTERLTLCLYVMCDPFKQSIFTMVQS